MRAYLWGDGVPRLLVQGHAVVQTGEEAVPLVPVLMPSWTNIHEREKEVSLGVERWHRRRPVASKHEAGAVTTPGRTRVRWGWWRV